jgi:TM2 domain-containing membrane protein YozV
MNSPGEEQIETAIQPNPQWKPRVLCGRCLYEIAGIEEGSRCPECGAVNIRGAHAGSHCTQLKYVVLAFFLGWLGVHNFAARRLIAGGVQLAVFLSAVALVLAGLSSRTIPIQQFSIALMMIGGLYAWALLEAMLVGRDGKGRPMPAARRRKR